jgi:hypothetical protein
MHFSWKIAAFQLLEAVSPDCFFFTNLHHREDRWSLLEILNEAVNE